MELHQQELMPPSSHRLSLELPLWPLESRRQERKSLRKKKLRESLEDSVQHLSSCCHHVVDELLQVEELPLHEVVELLEQQPRPWCCPECQ